jgi:hypothetical protein
MLPPARSYPKRNRLTRTAPNCQWSLGILQTEQEPIPKGLHHSAQGCAPRATLGGCAEMEPQPCRGCIIAPTGSFWPPCRNLQAGFSSIMNWHTTNGLCGIERYDGDERCNPFRVEGIAASASQGSARRATLGSVISSFQDGSPPEMSKLQGQAPTVRDPVCPPAAP